MPRVSVNITYYTENTGYQLKNKVSALSLLTALKIHRVGETPVAQSAVQLIDTLRELYAATFAEIDTVGIGMQGLIDFARVYLVEIGQSCHSLRAAQLATLAKGMVVVADKQLIDALLVEHPLVAHFLDVLDRNIGDVGELLQEDVGDDVVVLHNKNLNVPFL